MEGVPPLGVHAQGGSDVVAGTLGLVDVVQPHDVRSPVLDWFVAGWGSGKSGSKPSPGASHARPNGPSRSRIPRWETSRGRGVLVRTISSAATRRKWVTAMSSWKTTRTAGLSPWSSMGPVRGVVAQVGGEPGGHRHGADGPALPLQKKGPGVVSLPKDAEGVGVDGAHPA